MRSTIGRPFKMPTASYETLLTETCPHVVETWKQYQTIGQRFGDLPGKGRARTAEETKLMRRVDPGLRPQARHASRRFHDVQEALTGKRAISSKQARKLGQLFHVHPGLFL